MTTVSKKTRVRTFVDYYYEFSTPNGALEIARDSNEFNRIALSSDMSACTITYVRRNSTLRIVLDSDMIQALLPRRSTMQYRNAMHGFVYSDGTIVGITHCDSYELVRVYHDIHTINAEYKHTTYYPNGTESVAHGVHAPQYSTAR